jgi:hypothetical protein
MGTDRFLWLTSQYSHNSLKSFWNQVLSSALGLSWAGLFGSGSFHMHDNLQWYRKERLRAVNAMPEAGTDTAQVVTVKNKALAEAAQDLASALDFLDLHLERVAARTREG